MVLLKSPIEVCSIKTSNWTVKASVQTNVATADICKVPQSAYVVHNTSKAIIVGNDGVDLVNINRILRNPQEHAPELTALIAVNSTR